MRRVTSDHDGDAVIISARGGIDATLAQTRFVQVQGEDRVSVVGLPIDADGNSGHGEVIGEEVSIPL